jgi:hypothetical protein
MGRPLIIFVPGLLPKPRPDLHRDSLLRCLVAGLRRTDSDVAAAVENEAASFELVSWTYDFYGEHRDIRLDAAAIDAVVEQPEANARDIAEASAWTRRLTRWIYTLGDWLPFLIPHLASERMELHLRDLMRYEQNTHGVADHVRKLLKLPLLAAADSRRPVLLIGHSMGSVIAYDALWELTHEDRGPAAVDLLLTMGSPLGQRYIQRRIRGHDRSGKERFPGNIAHWKNLSAIGDLTAIDPWLANDFAEMVELGLVDGIDDELILNYFRLEGNLNVHAEYGYLANEKTAHTIARWWRGHDRSLPPESGGE